MAKRITIITKEDFVILDTSDYTHLDLNPDLVAAVNDANGRATAFTYTALEIVKLAQRAERRLNAMDLPQRDRVGFEASFNKAGPAAKSYKFSANGRRVSMRRTANSWVLISIDEVKIFPRQPERVSYRATERQIAEAARRAVADITPIAA